MVKQNRGGVGFARYGISRLGGNMKAKLTTSEKASWAAVIVSLAAVLATASTFAIDKKIQVDKEATQALKSVADEDQQRYIKFRSLWALGKHSGEIANLFNIAKCSNQIADTPESLNASLRSSLRSKKDVLDDINDCADQMGLKIRVNESQDLGTIWRRITEVVKSKYSKSDYDVYYLGEILWLNLRDADTAEAFKEAIRSSRTKNKSDQWTVYKEWWTNAWMDQIESVQTRSNEILGRFAVKSKVPQAERDKPDEWFVATDRAFKEMTQRLNEK